MVTRSHAGGYVVFLPEDGVTLNCQARGRIKKERSSILVGDRVELGEFDLKRKEAVIIRCLERSSQSSRPNIANVDQVVIVQAIAQPEWNQLWCDRYIVHFQLEMPDTMPILCINKCDLAPGDQALSLRNIYEELGYRVLLCSAASGIGMNELAELLSGRITVLAGPSGVGKSSLLNRLEPDLNLKTGIMENEFGVGRHTTTASELFQINPHFENLMLSSTQKPDVAWVVDTPGFNLSELRCPEPQEVMWQFPEIVKLKDSCRFSNCTHLVEDGCVVLEEVNREDTSPVLVERYRSYASIMEQSKEAYDERRATSTKIESTTKIDGGTVIPKLKGKYRAASRRKEKQRVIYDLSSDQDSDDIEEVDEDDDEFADE
ncbi:MAG: ribosome small subunit-dependent GTPase A [Candidatus Melainabacteria bacterium]|nr:ribosome small subunit-dependent GTPase A [Candidatus Melainabacteria bacterium]